MKSTERNWDKITIKTTGELDSFGNPSISIFHENEDGKCNGHIRSNIKDIIG